MSALVWIGAAIGLLTMLAGPVATFRNRRHWPAAGAGMVCFLAGSATTSIALNIRTEGLDPNGYNFTALLMLIAANVLLLILNGRLASRKPIRPQVETL